MGYAAWPAALKDFISSTISSAISRAMVSICLRVLSDAPGQVSDSETEQPQTNRFHFVSSSNAFICAPSSLCAVGQGGQIRIPSCTLQIDTESR
jgi:hypothetical protein